MKLYETFIHTSYWERQKIKTNLQETGTYYIVVFNDDQREENLVD
jgi:hypothetical protein